MKRKCEHSWGPTIYEPLVFYQKTCFSGNWHVEEHRWLRFCKCCGKTDWFYEDRTEEGRKFSKKEIKKYMKKWEDYHA